MTSIPREPPAIFVRTLPLSVLSGIALIWAFTGKIPSYVEARSIVLVPRSQLAIQSRVGGQITEILVKSGDTVAKNQLLAKLDIPELRESFTTEQQKLNELKQENQTITTVQNERTKLQRETLQRKEKALPQAIEGFQRQIQANTKQIEANNTRISANNRQRQAYQQRITQLNNINQIIKTKLQAYETLIKEGAIAPLSAELIRIIQLEQDNRNTITDLSAKLEDIQAENEALLAKNRQLKGDNDNQIASIQGQNANREDLKTQNRQLDLDNLQANLTRRNAITDRQRDIANLNAKINNDSRVLSPQNGKILDIAVNVGQVIPTGQRLGSIEVTQTEARSFGLAFFTIGDANRLQPGMTVEIVPDLYPRDRYGSIMATVLEVAKESVTPEEVSSIVGNDELAKSLAPNTPVVKVKLKLFTDPNTVSGYQWTNGEGVPQPIPNGTTANSRVLVEKRSLVNYLAPVLRNITGVYR